MTTTKIKAIPAWAYMITHSYELTLEMCSNKNFFWRVRIKDLNDFVVAKTPEQAVAKAVKKLKAKKLIKDLGHKEN